MTVRSKKDRGIGRVRPSQRRDHIVELVRAQERLSVEALAAELKISRETVRRDLARLASQGRLRKIHGGALAAESRHENAFALRLNEMATEKRAIARAAVALFAPGDTLFVDAGTTTLLFAEALESRPGVTLITNGVDIARAAARTGAKVFLIGGDYRDEVGEVVGPLAAAQIANFHAGHAVLTVGGVTEDGAMDFLLEEAEVARAMLARARTLTVLADHSKFGREALFQVCPLQDIDRIITDRPLSPSLARRFAEAGVEVLVAAPLQSDQAK